MDKNKVHKFYSDPGHGWLAVKLNDLIKLGLTQKISHYSYVKGQTVYLEEDSDMTKFFTAFREKFGQFPSMKVIYLDKNSPIRSYDRYPFDCVS